MFKHLGLTGNVASLKSPEKWINFQTEAGSQTGITPRLVSLGSSSFEDFNLKRTKRKWKYIDGGMVSGRDPLALGLSYSPSASESRKRSNLRAVSIISSAYVVDEECSLNLNLNLQHKSDTENAHFPKAPAVTPSDTDVNNPAFNLELSLSVGPAVSDITSEAGSPAQHLIDCTPRIIKKQNHSSSTKKCQSPGCQKGARDASERCITHGGGQRCQKTDCKRGAEGKTIYCKLHGGGRRCEKLGCIKSAEGSTDFCIAHGGGRRCSQVGCTTAARGKSGLCIKHGGGRRCEKDNCTKSAEGRSGLCIAHGGGKRCHHKGCTKGAQGSTMFCKSHGGGKRCSVEYCSKGAEGSTPFCKRHGGGKRCLFQGGGECSKSVHGGTQFCVAHGGGKRCATPECTKSARGRTDFCARHGGGKRCQFEGCGKSAQGRTDFCKAHGGGKMCSWGELEGSDIGSHGSFCNRVSTGKTALCVSHSALVQDHRVHGGDTMGTPTIQKPATPERMKLVVAEESGLFGWNALNQRKSTRRIIRVKSGAVSIPEGRVHGGRLMALMAIGDPHIQSESQAEEECSTSNQDSSHTMNYGCL